MQYRRLGRAGVRVSALSLGSWITYANQVDADAAVEMMAAAYDAGVNFFDNAEVYAGGRSETLMGEALRRLGWPRLNYLVSTKFFWGLDRQGEAVNHRAGVCRAEDARGVRVDLDDRLLAWKRRVHVPGHRDEFVGSARECQGA